ncbi:winged helix-turn-helix domain-containing protein [Nocardia farcinica]|nr:winged helix-turn-helix domain-containing protein [Nocardia farcinica]MBF6257215.1 winged helix-turn-helix domain-containing protein [Nocardia farcinica]MBF6265542.1 winged helix-turn-helix domain-containing protein [Nocardia farcinica]MBF6271287.1 winged helix-turn-helix domain-containing protein [Nocardia farcinica]MBF6422748.1 winged helix-turn-helix domain-containing protein [Nocardia farcinica]
MVYRAGMTTRDTTEPAPAAPTPAARGWTFLTNHAHVLLCLTRNGDLTMRELAQAIGITERAVQATIADLVADGYLTVVKNGRRNTYTIHGQGRLRHPLESHHTIDELITALR